MIIDLIKSMIILTLVAIEQPTQDAVKAALVLVRSLLDTKQTLTRNFAELNERWENSSGVSVHTLQ